MFFLIPGFHHGVIVVEALQASLSEKFIFSAPTQSLARGVASAEPLFRNERLDCVLAAGMVEEAIFSRQNPILSIQDFGYEINRSSEPKMRGQAFTGGQGMGGAVLR